jgi:predicted DsbA family dithiol-disulfide isomerase
MITIDVVFDLISPWCWIAKRRLEAAVQRLAGRGEVQVQWLPFELNPQMPPEGMERRAYRTARFGSWEQASRLDALIAATGQIEGLVFAFDRIARVPNTLAAHRLIALARQEGAGNAILEAMFFAYFTEGRDLAAQSTLLDIVAAAGLDRSRAACLLQSEEGIAELPVPRRRGPPGLVRATLAGDR